VGGTLLRGALLGGAWNIATRERGALLLIVAGEWENIVTFKNIVVSKTRLCEKQHCKRSKAKWQQEQHYERNIVNINLIHVSFLFIHNCTSLFLFPYKLVDKDNNEQQIIIIFFFSFLKGFVSKENDNGKQPLSFFFVFFMIFFFLLCSRTTLSMSSSSS